MLLYNWVFQNISNYVKKNKTNTFRISVYHLPPISLYKNGVGYKIYSFCASTFLKLLNF